MEFRIADTFTDSLARLTGDEQKAVKTTAFDLQLNPASPGMSFHKLDMARDKNFWSVRVNQDIRLIVHRSQSSLLLCYVAHHDDAYDWAERRKLETHPTTGAAQLVEVRELVREVPVTRYVEAPAVRTSLFDHISEASLLAYGVPVEWLPEVKQATDDTILEIADHLPAEAAEAVLALAVGDTPKLPEPVPAGTSPFEHPDAQRRFRVVSDTEELARALEYPWDRWMVFLHPAQRQTVERSYGGPARVSGSAGTGKTIVALHRAAHLARANPDARVLLTTFSEPLANALRGKLRRLLSGEPRLAERLEVQALDTVARRLIERNVGRRQIITRQALEALLGEAAEAIGERRSRSFLVAEWEDVVDAWQIRSWEAYRGVVRLGRKTRLPEAVRQGLWEVFARVHEALTTQGQVTRAGIYNELSAHYAVTTSRPYDFVVMDEAQDVSVPQLRFLATLAGDRPNGLFFAGDLGQRIFQQPFSWKSLGVDIRGRSSTLRINYRTSHQIRARADLLLGPEIADVDGIVESRRGTISVFNGPAPGVRVLGTSAEEIAAVAGWLRERAADGLAPHEIGIFVRSAAELDRASEAAAAAGLPHRVLDERVETVSGQASIGTMHLAKGLEFRSVVVMACDDDVIPSQERLAAVADESDLEEVYNTERHLLYVACTRARDSLLVTGVAPGSEFLEDIQPRPTP